jgi:hypothetical protein
VDAYSFPLAWRWTQATHSVFPAKVMAQITPIVQEQFEQLDEKMLGAPESIATNLISTEDVQQWLAHRPIDPETVVTVRWSRELAVVTTWSIFAEYWDDFCYPSSDDVDVVPVTRDWLLQYHHWEAFDFRYRN